MRLLRVAALISCLCFAGETARAQGYLPPQLLALLEHYFASLGGSNTIITVMIADGAITLPKIATNSVDAHYVTQAQLGAYETSSDAASTYLSQSDASSVYLTIVNAAVTYQTLSAWAAWRAAGWDGVVTNELTGNDEWLYVTDGQITGVWDTVAGAWR